MQHQINYINLSKQFSDSLQEIDNHSSNLLNRQDFLDTTNFFEALGICELAVKHALISQSVTDLFLELNTDSNLMVHSFYLADEDYERFFADVVSIYTGFANAGVVKANVYLHSLYLDARAGYKNEEVAVDYLKKGMNLGDKEAQAYIGYATYYGNLGFTENKEEGLRMIYDSFVTDNPVGELFALNIEFRNCNSPEEAQAVLAKYDELLHIKNRGLYVLADYYLRESLDAEALSTLQKGIETNSGYCNYLLGLMIVNGRFANFGFTLDQGKAYLEEGFRRGVIYAGFIKGYTTLYPSDGSEPNFELAMQELVKAVQYNSPEAQLELAMLYLYHADYKNVQEGLVLLDLAIDAKYGRAIGEKAYLLLDTDVVERDIAQGKQLLESAYDLGEAYAAFRLGVGYQDAEWEEEADYAKALEYFEIASDRGDGKALEYVAKYYRYGYAGEPKSEKARELYQQAIELYNSSFAKVELAMMFENGEGGDVDKESAKGLYESALNEGYHYAAARLGFILEEEQDLEGARGFFEIAADAELSIGVYHLARFYRYGMGGQIDEIKAFALFEQALEMGFVDANVDIALAYEEGSCGNDYDPEKAYQYMLTAAQEGLNFAMYKVGVYNMYNTFDGASKEEAVYWLSKAIEGGSPSAMLTLGDFYLYGYAEEEDYSKALEYYQQAEELDYISEGIGVCYQYAIGVEKDDKKAFNYYKIAADRQYGAAVYRLGLCYYYGIGIEQDKVEAFFYLKKIADEGNKDAAGYVGQMYVSGDGVEKDAVEGVHYLLEAAEAGYEEAQYYLGNCYLKGDGVDQSDEQAMHWYQLAAENGQEDAQKIVGGPRKRRR